ncbi:hypothetical protein BIV25_28280 [Streptomyces sp. MUSC 14]|nr:hypothetical protein BIV25_28280 [Streptomyces sp. MUSC 14]
MSRDHDEMLTVLHERAPYAEIVLEPLDKTIDSAAGAHGSARFVGLYDSSRNHSVCDSGKWVEAIGVSRPADETPRPPTAPRHDAEGRFQMSRHRPRCGSSRPRRPQRSKAGRTAVSTSELQTPVTEHFRHTPWRTP